MADNTRFPFLDRYRRLERLLFFADASSPFSQFPEALNRAFDRIGFTQEYVNSQIKVFEQRSVPNADAIEKLGASTSKVVKDIVWGMIELDSTGVALLDTPILQRLRSIRQNGFTYLVFPAASHVRLEHSLGVLAVVSQYIDSISKSAVQPRTFAAGLSAAAIEPKLAMDLKHAALLHDIGHFPLSHVLESIFESEPSTFLFGNITIRDFEIEVMSVLPDLKSRLSEKLSITILLSPRFNRFYSALRKDEWAIYRLACLVSGAPLDVNQPGYTQLISGAVDCDKVDYLLRDSIMCNVPVAIDKARLFLNSALVECEPGTIKKLSEKGVLSLKTEFDRSALTLVLNSSGVDTIEEVAFARAILYERVYRHAVTRNAERMLSIALADSAMRATDRTVWLDALNSFTMTDDTLLQRVLEAASEDGKELARRIRHRQLPKRAFAFSPEFYSPVVPYVDIFSNLEPHQAASRYYHEVTSKDPFHEIVEDLKETSAYFTSSEKHREIENKISDKAEELANRLRPVNQQIPTGRPRVFFIPLPDHSATPTSCAFVTREGELESSGEYSRAAQIVSAKEIGRSIGFVTCDPPWAEIVFLAAQEVIYDYFGDETAQVDIDLYFDTSESEAGQSQLLRVKATKRFYIAEERAARRCRLDRSRLSTYRRHLSEDGFYDRRPRLAPPEPLTGEIDSIANMFREFSGQHGWRVTPTTIRHFINQFPPGLRREAKKLLLSLNFLNRHTASSALARVIRETVAEIRKTNHSGVHLVSLAGTSARMMLELTKQESRPEWRTLGISEHLSIHDALGTAKAGDVIIFVDDNVSSGTQFSAQLLSWLGVREKSPDAAVKKEAGIEHVTLQPNERALLGQIDLWFVTCVGKAESNALIREKLQVADNLLKYKGTRFAQSLDSSDSGAELSSAFEEFLRNVGAACVTSSSEVGGGAPDENALGYGNSRGRTVTLWNVPTSTFTALWCPGIVDGEPWCPLFIRRGYAEMLVVA
jgi:deoxynucleoside triphosphate triphosphohydrolase SAMHD1